MVVPNLRTARVVGFCLSEETQDTADRILGSVFRQMVVHMMEQHQFSHDDAQDFAYTFIIEACRAMVRDDPFNQLH